MLSTYLPPQRHDRSTLQYAARENYRSRLAGLCEYYMQCTSPYMVRDEIVDADTGETAPRFSATGDAFTKRPRTRAIGTAQRKNLDMAGQMTDVDV